MTKKPVIGITPSHNTENDDLSLRPTYLRAISAAGGLPVLLPLEGSEEDRKQLAALCDGFLFSGGPDLHPFLLGEETQIHCGNVSPARDRMETQLLKLTMMENKPILGICRGSQLINVALGGDLYQDIPSQTKSDFPIAHSQPFYYNIPAHHVTVKEGTLLSKIAEGKTTLEVNSVHHQAVRRIAPGLIASACSPDGIVEAVEKPDYPFLLGVQWHPEYLWQTQKEAAELFKAFVDACRG